MPFPLVAAIPGLVQAGGGLLQSILGGSKAKKAESALENLKTPTYNANKGIMDYYNTAMQRYNVNPYQSQQYQYGQQQSNRNLSAGIGALQDRRSAVGGISRLAAGANDAALRNGMAAEQEQGQRFNQLGGATQMKAGDDRMAFQYNQVAPYEKNYNLLAMKAGAGANMQNAGIQNAFNGLSSLSMLGSDYTNNQPYGTASKQANGYGENNVPSSYDEYLRMQKYFGK